MEVRSKVVCHSSTDQEDLLLLIKQIHKYHYENGSAVSGRYFKNKVQDIFKEFNEK